MVHIFLNSFYYHSLFSKKLHHNRKKSIKTFGSY
nr:MAG TPA: hypothetical protein [Caudoviricetes sp.]